ncbi:MAG: c-type cytochrome [Gemmataceae bacterium]
MHRLSYTKVRTVTLAVGLGLALLAGCDENGRYPADLRYPERTDVLVKDPPTTDFRTPPAPPGRFEERIKKAAEEKVFPSVDPLGKDDQGKPLITREERAQLRAALEEIFGTPAAPSVEPIDPDRAPTKKADEAKENAKVYAEALAANMQTFDVKEEDIDVLFVDAETLSKGAGDVRRRTLAKGSELYRRHCLHCHGVAGDGRGPTGAWVDPHPRDYRQGMFKFLSTNKAQVGTGKPRKDDLLRTLDKGIDGTSMPAFGLLPRRELEQLASYVIHLSLRGQVEYETLYTLVKNRASIPEGDDGVKRFVYQQAALLTSQWALMTKLEVNKPPAYPYGDDSDKEKTAESIRRGHQLFLNKGICITCHYDYGRQSAYRYDTWGTVVRPRNLTDPSYRGGRRPIDIYWRISGGIPPSGMSKLPDGTTEQETWDLVNFVQALPYPAMLPKDVREKVYPTPGAKEHASATR